MPCKLGVIEGFYGEPWSWGARADYAAFLRKHGFSFYIYAPKGDHFLRRKWREPFPKVHEEKLAKVAAQCHSAGIEFGIGLSPFEIYLSQFDLNAKKKLQERLDVFNRIGADKLCLLMDDMKGDIPDLAARQAEIVNWAAARSKARQLVFCPTYYSADPVLEKLFGKIPDGYLEKLGKELDKKVSIFWTGDQVCSASYSADGLKALSERLGRKAFLWDNYPVNDGPKMCGFLHLRGVTGRPPEMGGWLEGHAANPMNQAALSKIPLLTLQGSCQKDAAYDPVKAFRKAARMVTCHEMAELLERDLEAFCDRGLDALSADEKAAFRDDYSPFLEEHENDTARAARELLDWLAGKYAVRREMIVAQ